jgi:hypothetical protein
VSQKVLWSTSNVLSEGQLEELAIVRRG